MVTLEIIGFKNVSLPRELQKLFPDWNTTHTVFYTIYTIKLDYLGDEHIEPLDRAYKGKLIAHWESDDDWSASTYNL